MAKPNKFYDYLNRESGPKVIDEALRLFGTKEIKGPKHNKVIMDWAADLGLKEYTADEIAWCGLFTAIVVKRAGFEPVKNPLWALNWNNFGNKVDIAMKGDILVFKRDGGGHVGFYVGEDPNYYHVLGGNQSDMVNIMKLHKSRVVGIRRCPWKISQPTNVRRVILGENNQEISTNEK